jgi:hypothetical protein
VMLKKTEKDKERNIERRRGYSEEMKSKSKERGRKKK